MMLIENTPTSKIRSIAMGLVELYGKVVAKKEVLTSPLAQKPCVHYYYTIEEYRRQGKHNRWVVVFKETSNCLFLLKDNTGQVLVNLKDAIIEIPSDFEYSSSFGRDPPLNIRNFLKQKRFSHEGFFGINKSLRFREYLIQPGDQLYVFGTAADNPYVKEATSQKNDADIMIQKGKNLYYVSDRPEKDILKSLSWKAYGGLFGGAALTLVCLVIVFVAFGI